MQSTYKRVGQVVTNRGIVDTLETTRYREVVLTVSKQLSLDLADYNKKSQ